MQNKGIKGKSFPTTGLDATLTGLQNILARYQCGTVYKPIYLEAQAAAALAMYVRAGVTPPESLLNWHITDPQTQTSVASVLLTPEWVTKKNMNSTVIADKSVPVSELCGASTSLPAPLLASGRSHLLHACGASSLRRNAKRRDRSPKGKSSGGLTNHLMRQVELGLNAPCL